jgi:hypothetical protein
MQRQAHFHHLANKACVKTASTKVLTVETQQHCNKNQLCNDNVVNHLCNIHWDMISMFKKLVLKWNWTHQNFNLQVESEVLLVWLKGWWGLIACSTLFVINPYHNWQAHRTRYDCWQGRCFFMALNIIRFIFCCKFDWSIYKYIYLLLAYMLLWIQMFAFYFCFVSVDFLMSHVCLHCPALLVGTSWQWLW